MASKLSWIAVACVSLSVLSFDGMAESDFSLDPIHLFKRSSISETCKSSLESLRTDSCFTFAVPENKDPSIVEISNSYKSYSNSQCNSECDKRRTSYAQSIRDNCINGYRPEDANVARVVASAAFFAHDMACLRENENSGNYCISSVLDQLSTLASQQTTASINNTPFKIETCRDKKTLIIKPFKINAIPKNVCCEQKCFKKFVVGSYAWQKLIVDRLGKDYLTKDDAGKLDLPEWKDMSNFADDLNAKCNMNIVDKQSPIPYTPGNFTVDSTPNTTTLPYTPPTPTGPPAPAPYGNSNNSGSTTNSSEGQSYYAKVPGYFPSDQFLDPPLSETVRSGSSSDFLFVNTLSSSFVLLLVPGIAAMLI